MELKPIERNYMVSNNRVLIEPLWNWNLAIPSNNTRTRYVLIEPLWNWNCLCFSETAACNCINRTFMELKQKVRTGIRSITVVLIEPLWNWNFLTVLAWLSSTCINRTFMELKPTKEACAIKARHSINRTFMELKPRTRYKFRAHVNVLIEPLWNWNAERKRAIWLTGRINRTFMELKPSRSEYDYQSQAVLIEPLWNWNSFIYSNKLKSECKY